MVCHGPVDANLAHPRWPPSRYGTSSFVFCDRCGCSVDADLVHGYRTMALRAASSCAWCRTSRVEPVHLRTSSEQPVGRGGTSDAPHRTPDRLLSAMRREFGGHAELLARGIEASRCLQRLCNVAVTLSVGLRRPRDGRLRRLLLLGLLREPCLPCAPC